MSFTIGDFQDLLEILQQHPEWRMRLIETLLGEEFLRLPQQMQAILQAQQRTDEHLAALAAEVRALAEAQRRTDERLEQLAEAQRRTDERLEQLAEAQRRTDERLEQLAAEVRKLAEAQRRTDERLEQLAAEVRALAEAQRRTDERLEQLAEAQRRTDERLDRLTEEVRALAEAQRRMYEEFNEFRASTQRRLDEISKELRNLANHVGMTLEEEAEDMVWWVLKQKGYQFSEGRQSVVYDGEVDVVLLGVTPEGENITVVVESKVRLGKNDVFAWLQRVQSESFRSRMEAEGFSPPYFPYLFTMRPDPAAVDTARQLGIGLVTTRGEVAEGRVIIR